MSDNWDFYFSNVNDEVASILVNLGISDSVPDPQRPWLQWIWVYFQKPSDDGYPTPDENEDSTLDQIEEALTQAVKESLEAEMVGRITTQKRREFFFYGPRAAGFEEAVADALKSFPAYQFKMGTREDPDWSHYLDILYPTPEDLWIIRNRHLVEVLEGYGDSLQAPRSVNHWIYFKSPEDRHNFVAEVVNSGFNVIEESEDDDVETKLRYGVELERVDHVDWDSINHVTLQLLRLTKQVGGKYDGWETIVLKNSSFVLKDS
jgi:uncharacterized protein (TIGR01619 family)